MIYLAKSIAISLAYHTGNTLRYSGHRHGGM